MIATTSVCGIVRGVPSTVTITHGVISSITPLPEDASHTSLPLLVPGFVDLHNHGGLGGGFPTGTEDECRKAALFHRSQGTVVLFASLVSALPEELLHQIEILGPLFSDGTIDGIHMEGPFVNVKRKGAQNPAAIYPGNATVFREAIAAGQGAIASMTFAPETENVDALLELCAEHNIVASLGHTDGTYARTREVIDQAEKLGVHITATHLFNAMPQIHHREPGAAAALLEAAAEGRISVELVADGIHLDDGTVDMVHAAAGTHAFAITDAMAAAGMSDGAYVLGHLGVTVSDGVARLTDGGAIAGGTSTLADQFARFARRHGIEEAVRFTSTNAARACGRHAPEIAVGAPAQYVALDAESLRPLEVFTPSHTMKA